MKIRESKRKKLAAKGWTIGSAKEFLELSSEEAAYIELRLKLPEGLKMRPHSRGVAQTQLAQTLHSSQSRVAKMEAGDPGVGLDLLVKSLLAFGASNRQEAPHGPLQRLLGRRLSLAEVSICIFAEKEEREDCNLENRSRSKWKGVVVPQHAENAEPKECDIGDTSPAESAEHEGSENNIGDYHGDGAPKRC
ncbi:MAG TPA: hypothetical protein VET46_00370 [Steroidobacteraceae bacterium]|nr:hypothetical protein [Steroidobacteraceae bacterium]